MKKDSAGALANVRLQIPLREELAQEVAYLAARMDRSQAWMAARLLEEAIADQNALLGWLERFVVRAVGKSVRLFSESNGVSEERLKVIRLQVPVGRGVAEQVAAVGVRLNHTQVQMAALLLEWAVRDHGWLIEVVTTKWGKAVLSALYSKHQIDGGAEFRDKADGSNKSGAA